MPFYPLLVPIPSEKSTERIFLRPLRVTDVELDYAAVMSSAEMLRRWSGSSWPSDDFTLAENRADLERHQREHDARIAFTYTVLNPAQDQCLGCVYIQPSEQEERAVCPTAKFPTTVGFWVRAAEIQHDLDLHLFNTLRAWLASEWQFDCILYVIRPAGTRQASIFQSAGLALRQTLFDKNGQRLVFN
jgi:hypothetical protein